MDIEVVSTLPHPKAGQWIGRAMFAQDTGLVSVWDGAQWHQIGAGGGGSTGWEFFETYTVSSWKQDASGDLNAGSFASDLTTSGMTFTAGTGTNPDLLNVALLAIPSGYNAWLVEIDEQISIDTTTSAAAPQVLIVTPSSLSYEEYSVPQEIAGNTTGMAVGQTVRALVPASATQISWKHSSTVGSVSNASANNGLYGSVRIAAYKYQNGQTI